MGVCALVPAKATSQNHVHQLNNILVTPMPPAPGRHRPTAKPRVPQPRLSRALGAVRPCRGENICCISHLLILLPALTHGNSKLNPEMQ